MAKTAVLTLRARADEHRHPNRVFSDPTAAQWSEALDWPEDLSAWYGPSRQSQLAFRADDIDRILARFAEPLPSITVVELGCGLSTRRRRVPLPNVEAWFDLDLPEIIEVRRRFGADADGSQQIGTSVLEEGWLQLLPREGSSLVFIAEGLIHYLTRADVDALLAKLRARFSGAAMILDVVGANEHADLLRCTSAIGAPVQWKLEGDFRDVLSNLGLGVVPDFEPERLAQNAIERYWPRFDAKLRAGIYFAMSAPTLWAARSGNVVGRLS
ncbi:MAG: class I SAM-dependent methyltransferase [Deltaproteobacteria bacterium]|nr:class I SAM-dependent methyltransferase [Deltaproteobacteria bacterium]